MAVLRCSTPQIFFLRLVVMASLVFPSSAQSNCTGFSFSQNRLYALCNSLPRLGSSIHWTYHPFNATVDIAYRAPHGSNAWVAWGINPTGPRMVGTQALVAFQNSSSNTMAAYTTPVSSYSPSMQPASISFAVTGLQAEYSGGVTTIYASLSLPSNQTRVNHVWQSSTIFSGGYPAGHPFTGDNVNSYGTWDLLSGTWGLPSRDSSSVGHNARTGRKLLLACMIFLMAVPM